MPKHLPGPPATPFAAWLDSLVPALFESDAALARAVGMPQANITRWRAGTRPGIPALLKLANATGAGVEYLLKVAGYSE